MYTALNVLIILRWELERKGLDALALQMKKLKSVKGDRALGRFVRGENFDSVWKVVTELQATTSEKNDHDEIFDNNHIQRNKKTGEGENVANETPFSATKHQEDKYCPPSSSTGQNHPGTSL
eukprot:1155546-Ditylum_brightwellii.AAC.1